LRLSFLHKQDTGLHWARMQSVPFIWDAIAANRDNAPRGFPCAAIDVSRANFNITYFHSRTPILCIQGNSRFGPLCGTLGSARIRLMQAFDNGLSTRVS